MDEPTCDDLAVIERVLAGEVEAFRLLVTRYQDRVFCLLRNLVCDAHACDDLAQDVFVSAYVGLRRYDPARGRFATWLLRIARNKCLNALAKRRPTPSESMPDPPDLRTPPDVLAGRELFQHLDRALEGLPVERRTAFVLCEMVGLSGEEVSQIEHVAAGTVRSRLSRAKAALRGALRPFVGDAR
jgi:RNA polymerase sigma-70 factor (ECF subfamily)